MIKNLIKIGIDFNPTSKTVIAGNSRFALTKTYQLVINPLKDFSLSICRTAENPASKPNMKKQFLLILSIAVSTVSFSQSKISLGGKVGLSSAGMRGDAVNNLNNLLDFADGMVTTRNVTGFFAGTYVNIPVDDVISIEPGLYYSQKGYEMKGQLNLKGMDFLGANAKAQLQSQYVDMPVLLKANLGGLQLFAGPQFSYLAHADLKTTAGILGLNLLNSKLDATNQLNRWDAAVTGGIGYQFNNGINITASYDYGLSKTDANKNLNAYNNAIKIGLGINF
jgi:hypothetical protein